MKVLSTGQEEVITATVYILYFANKSSPAVGYKLSICSWNGLLRQDIFFSFTWLKHLWNFVNATTISLHKEVSKGWMSSEN